MSTIEIREIDGEAGLDDAFAIRKAVFCVEQGVHEGLEIDGRDPLCRHFLVRQAGIAIGTARIRPIGPGRAKIERVAVLAPYRGRGIGRRLMEALLSGLEASGTGDVVLHAQARTERFYLSLGFTTEGAPFEEAGIEHVRMTRKT